MDWEIVGESSDPVPGDPEELAAIGKELRELADLINRQASGVETAIETDAWQSETAEEFREESGDAVDKLRKAYARYDAAADALGSTVVESGLDHDHNTYASELNRAQRIADAAVREAAEAQSALDSATRAIEGLPDDIEDDDAELTSLEDEQETAQGIVSNCTARVQEAKEIRDNAVSALVAAIEDVIEDSTYKDGRWDWMADTLGQIADIAGTIAAVAGIAALGVGWFPIGGQALAAALGAIALAAGAVSLLANTALAATGNGSWVDVGVDALSIATMGVGRAALAGARAADVGLRGMARSGIARQSGLKKDWNRANRLSQGLRGKDHRRAVDNMPDRALTPHLREGFSPRQMASETWQAVRNARGGGGGPFPGSWNQLNPELSSLGQGLRNLDPEAAAQPGVVQGIQTFKNNCTVWTVSSATGLGTAVKTLSSDD